MKRTAREILDRHRPATSTHLYHAWYFGGPCDGDVVVATRLDGKDRWSTPVVKTIGNAGSDAGSTTEVFEAVYKLSRTCHLIDHDTPTIRYEYEFVGLEALPVTRSVDAGWLTIMKNRLKRLLHSSLWLSPPPEGRPHRPGQAGRLLSCPGRRLGLNSNRATVAKPSGNSGGRL